jgi:hypothetical protein
MMNPNIGMVSLDSVFMMISMLDIMVKFTGVVKDWALLSSFLEVFFLLKLM